MRKSSRLRRAERSVESACRRRLPRNLYFLFLIFLSGQLRTLGAGQREKMKRKYVPVRLYAFYFSLLLGRGSDYEVIVASQAQLREKSSILSSFSILGSHKKKQENEPRILKKK